MKKLSRILTLLLFVCSMAMIFSACGDEHDKITATYAKLKDLSKAEVSFTCYGEFDDVHVLMFSGLYPDAESNEVVDGVVFQHSQVKTFDVYHKGNFYSLNEAFSDGLLTHDDLLTLHDRYNPIVQGADDGEYRLTVIDPKDHLIEPLQETYRTGERVTVKTGMVADATFRVYLDGVSLGYETPVLENDEYHWEFYFTMPAHNAILSFTLRGGI